MKNKNNFLKVFTMIVALCTMQLFLPSLSVAQLPVSWTSYYEAGDNTFPPPPTVFLKSIAYNPVNNNIYEYGQKFFNLPAQPSGHVFTRELGVVRYDNVSGGIISEVYDVHHDNTTLIPRSDEAGAMAIAADGSVYVTGKRYYDDTYLYDMVVIKYNSALVEQWRFYIFSPGAADDAGIAITVDPVTGNIFAAGQLGDNGTGTGKDFVIAKFTPSGNVWQKVYNTSGMQDDTPTDIAADGSGNSYITGYSVSPTNGNQYTTVKFSPSGVKKWTKYYNGAPGTTGSDIANSIAADPIIHRIYVTGTSDNASGNSDIVTLAYDADGTKLWTKKINNPGDSRDRGFKIQLSQELVYVGGDVDRDISSAINGDLIYREYDSSGVVMRTKKYNGSGYNCEFGDLAVAQSGTAYMTGWCTGAVIPPAEGDFSMMTVKYNGAGAFQWGDFVTPTDPGSANGYYGFKMAINTATSEAVTGGRHWFWGPGAHPNEWMTRRYNPTLREADETIHETNEALSAEVYPNPATDHFTIQISKPCDIMVMNVNGQIVYQAKAENNFIEINSSNWSAGIYSVMFRSNEEQLVKKIVKQ
jgi:hypothetical protein